MLYGCIQPHNRFLSSQLSSGWRVSRYLHNSAISKCCAQVKWLLNRVAKACPGLLLMRLNKSWCCCVTGKSMLVFAEVKTDNIILLINAKSKTTSKASLILIKPDVFYSVTMTAGKQNHAAPSLVVLQLSSSSTLLWSLVSPSGICCLQNQPLYYSYFNYVNLADDVCLGWDPEGNNFYPKQFVLGSTLAVGT